MGPEEGRDDMKTRLAAGIAAVVLLSAFGAQPVARAAAAMPGAAEAYGGAVVRASACRPGQLRLGIGRRVPEKTQQATVILVVRNSSARRCELDGYPVVSLVTAHGRVLPFRFRDHGDQMLTSARPHPVLLAPGGAGYFGINKNACVGRSAGLARYLAIFPPGQLRRRLRRYPLLDYCGRRDPGHVVDISPVEKTARAVLARS
jgi:hypothetical protein